MSIRKSLIALAAMALALMGLASPAMAATDGRVRDVVNDAFIANGTKQHLVGWAEFFNGLGGIKCHVTAETEATTTDGTTGTVTNFTIPDTTKCTGEIFFAGCTVASHVVTGLPYHLTATPTDFDVTGTIRIHNTFGNCFVSGTTLEFSAITLKPLKTGTKTVTNTSNLLGTTAAAGEPIAGVELSGTGNATGIGTVEVAGELELTTGPRCTYKLVAS